MQKFCEEKNNICPCFYVYSIWKNYLLVLIFVLFIKLEIKEKWNLMVLNLERSINDH